MSKTFFFFFFKLEEGVKESTKERSTEERKGKDLVSTVAAGKKIEMTKGSF